MRSCASSAYHGPPGGDEPDAGVDGAVVGIVLPDIDGDGDIDGVIDGDIDGDIIGEVGDMLGIGMPCMWRGAQTRPSVLPAESV